MLDLVNSLPYVDSITILPEETVATSKQFFDAEYLGAGFVPDFQKTLSANDYDYGYAEFQIDQINGIPLHQAGYSGQGTMIAVLDGGFSGVQEHFVFDSLWVNNQILGTKDFVNGGENVYTESGHGRAVLSTMGANSPGIMVGTAPKADYWLLRTEDVKSEHVIEEFNWVSGAEFADSVGADVINSSLSYSDFEIPAWTYSHEDLDGRTPFSTMGAVFAMRKGILVCNSAGNSGNSEFPWNGAPADADSILSVGAVDINDNKAGFSSIGPTGDGRIKPDVMAMGAATIVAYGTDTIGPGYGTSYASPIIAGISACLIQANPDTDLWTIRSSIKQSATNSGDPNNQIGWGIPDYELANSNMTTVEYISLESDILINAWPNPFYGDRLNITINTRNLNNGTLQLVDISGNILAQEEISSSRKSLVLNDLEDLPAGIYFIKVIADSRAEVAKLVKQ